MLLYDCLLRFTFDKSRKLPMTRQSASNLRKLNGHLVHLALEVEEKVNNARKDYYLEQMLLRLNKQSKVS